ncbi:MAG: hypothetical protein ACRYF0_02685 [Janthinobacterium lividum]
MSIETLTGDEFATLTLDEHTEALDLYDVAISKTIAETASLEEDYDKFAEGRDRLGRLLTLRKVHQVRLEELEQPRAPRGTAEQYADNARSPQLAS